MTTRRLVLIRHAKAESGGADDARRPLAEQGRGDAQAIGRWLADLALVPERVVVSPARRARQTWVLVAAELDPAPQVVVDDRIYDNTVEDLLGVIADTDPGVTTLGLVGHSPAIADLSVALDGGRGNSPAMAELARKYPTSGIAVFDIDSEWAHVGRGAGRLLHFTAPRHLKA